MKYQFSKSKAKLATIALASALAIGVSTTTLADEVSTTDTPVIADSNTSDTPVIADTSTSDTPVIPSDNTGTSSSSETGNTGTTDMPAMPSESSETENSGATDTPVNPSTDNSSTDSPSTNEGSKTEMGESDIPTPSNPQDTETPLSGEVTVPTNNGGTATVTPDTSVPTNNSNISAGTAKNAGASQVGTTSTITGQIVQDVTSASPVYTNTGATIISTKNGQVVLNDGKVVNPEEIGAKSNEDGTISVTTKDGKTETLPHTGISDVISVIMSILGMFLLIFGMTFLRPSDKKVV